MKDWLNWAVGELELRDIVNVEKFPDINGRELCNLGREDFVRIVGSYHATDKLMEQLNSLREGSLNANTPLKYTAVYIDDDFR